MSVEVERAPAAPQSDAPAPGGGGAAATTTTWRYIGLYGHSVGTLTLDSSGLTWKSTSRPSSRGGNEDDENTGTTKRVPAKLISTASWTVFGRSGYLRVTTKTKDGGVGNELRFDGFPEKDYNKLADSFDRLYGKRIGRKNVSCSGASFGVTDIHDKNLVFRESLIAEGEEGEAESGEEIVSLDLTEVTQCVLPGNNRNEIELQFHESDTVEQNTDQLVQIRFYVPPDPDTDPTDKESLTAAELFQQRIVQRANIKSTTGNVIAKFDEVQGTFLTPRGRYTIELYDRFLRLRGNKYDYKIKYDDISRLFLLPKPDEVHMAFVIALDKPIRQGQQRYQYLVMQTTKAQSELTIHLDEETLQKEYNGDLQPVMQGSLSNLVAKTFKVVTGKKVFVPGKFANANQYACVKCALRANEGHLYPLEKQFIFIHKPSVLIRFDEVESVEFQRYAGGQGSTRNFDLCVALKHGGGGGADGGPREYVFSGIDRSDYAALYSFLSGKKIRIKNLEGMDPAAVAGGAPPALLGEMTPAQATAEAMAMMEDEDDEESEDEDYESGEASSSEAMSDEEGGSGSGSDDDDDMGSVSDSDLEEYRKKAKEEAAGKRKADEVVDDDGDDFIVDDEGDKKKKKKKKGKGGKEPKTKKTKTSSAAAPPAKKAKKAKRDPNAPKKYLTSFMMYSNSRRAAVREENPDASFGDLGKIIGAEWKKLTDDEKKEWNDKSAEDKVRYEKEMAEYEKTKTKDDDEEGGDGDGDGGASDDDDEDGGDDDASGKKKKKKKKKDKKEKKKKSKKSKEKGKTKTKSKSKKKKREASSEDEGVSEEEASADSRSTSGDDSD